MGSVRNLIKRSMQNIGALGVGESIPDDESTDLFNRLNNMIGNWSTQGALIFTDTEITHVLSANDGEYTIGSGADINTPRPIKIKYAFVRDSDNTDHSIEIIDEYKYSRISDKNEQSSYPDYLYYKTGHPTGTIILIDRPSQAYTLHLGVLAPLTAFTGLSQTISLPEGYEEAIEYNFCKRIAGSYGKVLTQEQVNLADNGLRDIKRANRVNDRYLATTNFPGQSYGSFDVYTRRGD